MKKFNELVESVLSEKWKHQDEDIAFVSDFIDEYSDGSMTAYVPNGQDFIVIKSKSGNKYKMKPEDWEDLVYDLDREFAKQTGGTIVLNSDLENYKNDYIQVRVK